MITGKTRILRTNHLASTNLIQNLITMSHVSKIDSGSDGCGAGGRGRGGGRVMLWVNKKRRRKCKCPSTARRQERKNKACKTTHNGHKRVVSIDRKALCEIFTQKPAHTPFFPLSVSFLDTHTPVRAQDRTHAHIRTHTHTHTHTHTRVRANTHTHTHIHTKPDL